MNATANITAQLHHSGFCLFSTGAGSREYQHDGHSFLVQVLDDDESWAILDGDFREIDSGRGRNSFAVAFARELAGKVVA